MMQKISTSRKWQPPNQKEKEKENHTHKKQQQKNKKQKQNNKNNWITSLYAASPSW